MVDVSLADYSGLLEKLYDGAMETSPWQCFLQSLCDLLNLRGCYLFLRFPTDNDDGLMFSSAPDFSNTPKNTNIYNQHFFTSDPLVISSVDEVVFIDDLIDEKELLQSVFYKKCMAPANIRFSAGIDLEFESRQRFSFRLARSFEQGPFLEHHRVFIRMLSGHVRRAIVAGEKILRFDRERNLWANSISGNDIGIVMLDEAGLVVRSNPAADRYLREKDGLAQINKQIHIKKSDLNEQFKQYISDALLAQKSGSQIPVGALSVPGTSGKQEYELVIKPVPIDPLMDSRGSPHLSVFIYSPQKNEDIDSEVLVKLYKLTATEARVAIALGHGQTVDELSTSLGIAVNTARAHIRSIFTKTCVTQQTQLVRLVLKSLASRP